MSISQDIIKEVEKFSELLKEYNEIVTKLSLISHINPGDTICITNLSIMKYKTLYTAIYRSYNNEDRIRSREWIQKAFEEYEILIEKLVNVEFVHIDLEKKLEEKIIDLRDLYNRALRGQENFEENYIKY